MLWSVDETRTSFLTWAIFLLVILDSYRVYAFSSQDERTARKSVASRLVVM
jgi:hypothetical protein